MGQGMSCSSSEEQGLFSAVQLGDLEMFEAILKRDSSLIYHSTDYNGYTPLHIAAAYGQIEILSLLLDQSVKPDLLNRHKQLGIDPSAPPRPDWWYPVLDRALQQFTVGLCSEEAPKEPIYASPFLGVLQEFVQGLAGGDAEHKSFAQFGLYPPQPLACDFSNLPSSREDVLERLITLYKDETNFTQSLVGDLSKERDPFPDVDTSEIVPVLTEGAPSVVPNSVDPSTVPSSEAPPDQAQQLADIAS